MQYVLKNIVNQLSKLRLLSFEKVVILYIFITSFIVIFNHSILPNYENLILIRIGILLAILSLVTLSSIFNKGFIIFMRYAFIALSLIYWYPETFDINRIFNNMDFRIANWEQLIFGFQPALVLKQIFTNRIFNELVHFGYFSYYLIIALVGFYIYYTDRKNIERYLFTLCFAFFSYYLFFVCFPTAGPQYYFPAIGIENVQAGHFPNLYQYFSHNANLTTTEKSTGLFFSLVEYSQQIGERPTAAFPSSHVGITTIILMFLAFNRHLKAVFLLMPIYLILVFSTVYIQAHYAIDVFAGFVSAVGLMYLTNISFPLFSQRFELNTFVFERVKTKTAVENN